MSASVGGSRKFEKYDANRSGIVKEELDRCRHILQEFPLGVRVRKSVTTTVNCRVPLFRGPLDFSLALVITKHFAEIHIHIVMTYGIE